MSINIKKYTKDQMAKMVEDAAERLESLRSENADLAERLKKATAEKIALRNDLMAKAHSVEELKADLDASKAASKLLNDQGQEYWRAWQASKREVADLKNKLNDTEAALGRANAELGAAEGALGEMNDKIVRCEAYSRTLRGDANKMQLEKIGTIMRADYAEAHPWRNLWAWIKRKLKMA